MSLRRFKGMPCVYCAEKPAATRDHLFARGFFLEPARANLPQVPACDECNNRKSQLELYLTALLPFGGRHADAHENLTNLVPGRLAKNLRLARSLNAHRDHIWHLDAQVYQLTMTLPVDPIKIVELFSMIGHGLVWYHWQSYISIDQESKALLLSSFGRKYFDRIFAMNAKSRVHQDIGTGTVAYHGVQAVDTPSLTLWRIRFYGGISFAGDPAAPAEVSNEIGVVTGPRRLVAMFSGRSLSNA